MWKKPTEYAIRALVYIALQNKKGLRPGFREIAGMTGTPEQFTAKILQQLTKASVIKSAKGRNGGFYFSDPDKELFLIDVLRVTEGDDFMTNCGFGFETCNSENPCPLHDNYLKIREAYDNMARKESIQSMTRKIVEKKSVLSR
jgi:Rrf2 family protein